MNFYKTAALLFVTATFTLSCSKEEDTSGPDIDVKYPEQNAVYKYGDDLIMNLTFSDDSGLISYKYVLEPVDQQGVKFTNTKEYFLTQFVTYYSINHKIVVPIQYSDAVKFDNGQYRLKISAVDFNNNVSSKEVLLTIENKTEE